jgi:hypothetical protein
MTRHLRRLVCKLRGHDWAICDHPCWNKKLASPFICARCRVRDQEEVRP